MQKGVNFSKKWAQKGVNFIKKWVQKGVKNAIFIVIWLQIGYTVCNEDNTTLCLISLFKEKKKK